MYSSWSLISVGETFRAGACIVIGSENQRVASGERMLDHLPDLLARGPRAAHPCPFNEPDDVSVREIALDVLIVQNRASPWPA